MKHAYIILKKRRYPCSYGKGFSEKYNFLASYQRRTIRLSFKIIDLLRSTRSIKSVAQETNVSSHTVTRLLDTLSYSAPKLPNCISIDELNVIPKQVNINVFWSTLKSSASLIFYQIEHKVTFQNT